MRPFFIFTIIIAYIHVMATVAIKNVFALISVMVEESKLFSQENPPSWTSKKGSLILENP